MALIPAISRGFEFLRSKEHTNVKKALNQMFLDVRKVVNGRLSLGSPQSQSKGQFGNLDGVWPGSLNLATGYTLQTPPVSNTEFIVTHNLGRVPTGYDVKSQDQAGVVYDSRRSSWNKQVMYLKCNMPSMNIVLYVH